jgi:hypothetical protein
VHRMIVAVIDPANTPHGYNWTFAFPMLLFIVIAAILYALFSRPHRRVPARRISAVAAADVPDAGTARAASVAGGLSVSAGGGVSESASEPSGAHLAASATSATADDPGEGAGESAPAADTDKGSEASE